MSEIKVSQVTEIDNVEISELAMHIVLTMQLAVEKATAHQAEADTYPISSDPNSFERLFLSRFQQLDPKQQQVGISNVMAAINAPEAERIRIYGDLAKVDLRSADAVETQTENLLLPESLKSLHIETNTLLKFSDEGVSRIASGLTHSLELRIHRVKCIEDTNEPGRDEISLGGNTVDESGNTEKTSAFNVGKFKSGREVNYSPPKTFTTFDLLNSPGVGYPRSYFVTLVLAEIDAGGFSDFLDKLLDKIKEEVIKKLTVLAASLGMKLGAMIASGIPLLGTAIGAIIGTVVGWVVGKIIEWIKKLWRDDIFTPFTVRADVPSLNASFQTPQGTVPWKDFGGEYHLWYDWSIKVPQTAPAVNANADKVFVVTEDGHLYSKWWNGTQLLWADQGIPSGTAFVTAPAVNADGGRVFVTASNGHLYLNWWDGTQWQWRDEGMPPSGTRVVTAPAVNANADKVFVVTEDGHLYSKWWNGTQLLWADQGIPSGTAFVTAPAVNADGGRVFVTASNGHLYLNWWDGTQWQWNDEGMPPSGTRVVTAPAVQADAGKVFVVTEDGHLYAKWWDGTQLQWADQGRP